MRPESPGGVSPIRGLEPVGAGSLVDVGPADEVVGGVGSVDDGGGPPYFAPQLTLPKTSAELTATAARRRAGTDQKQTCGIV